MQLPISASLSDAHQKAAFEAKESDMNVGV